MNCTNLNFIYTKKLAKKKVIPVNLMLLYMYMYGIRKIDSVVNLSTHLLGCYSMWNYSWPEMLQIHTHTA